jgi:hypothetical protein
MSEPLPTMPTLTDETIETIAEEAASHRRTVERRLLGLHVRGRVATRIDAVLAKRGLLNSRAPSSAA